MSKRPWSNKPTERCYKGHPKDGRKTQKRRRPDGKQIVYEARYCKTCARANMGKVMRGYASVRITRFLYFDVSASAKKNKRTVIAETQRLLVAALKLEAKK